MDMSDKASPHRTVSPYIYERTNPCVASDEGFGVKGEQQSAFSELETELRPAWEGRRGWEPYETWCGGGWSNGGWEAREGSLTRGVDLSRVGWSLGADVTRLSCDPYTSLFPLLPSSVSPRECSSSFLATNPLPLKCYTTRSLLLCQPRHIPLLRRRSDHR